MASFNAPRFAASLTLAQLIPLVGRTFLRVQHALNGFRRDDLGRSVWPKDIEVEDAGGGLVVTTPDGSNRYRISVDDSGSVTATAL